MNSQSQAWGLSKRSPLQTFSLPLPQPPLPLESQVLDHTPTTSSTLFDNFPPPEYSENGEDIEPPSFSQVVLTLDLRWSFIQPLTKPSNESIPLYAISTGINEDQKHITTIQRLYHKFSSVSSPSPKGSKIKRTALPIYEMGPGKTRYELKPLLESASYLDVVHAERIAGMGSVRWEFYVQVKKTGMGRKANTKNELVRGKTEIITTHIYRTQLMPGVEGAVEWINENDEVITYESQGGKKGKAKMRTKSEAAAEYVEVMDKGSMREQSPRKGRRSFHGISEKDDVRMLPIEVSMPTLKIARPLGRNEME